jgi:hypothetical protein
MGLAVDSGNPQLVIVSASIGSSKAYSPENAESFVYRRDEVGKKWRAASNSLPEPVGKQSQFLLRIQRFRESSRLLTTVVYLYQLI